MRQSGDELSDIRVENARLKPKNFDPRKYYRKGYFFFGLDEHGKPIEMSVEEFQKNNLKIIGLTQTGKGVSQGLLLDQAIKKGMGAWFIDLKPDDFIYDIMVQACEEAGRPKPIIVDLTGRGIGNYAPFQSGTIRERMARVYYAFGLDDSDSDADFYKAKERKAINHIKTFWDGTLMSLQKLLHNNLNEFDDLENINLNWVYESTERTRSYLSEWLSIPALNPKPGRGLDIKRTLDNGGVVYIRGSMTDPLVAKATTVLLMELIQTALAHGRFETHSFIATDEIRFLINDMLPKGLASVLSKGINMSVAYQTVMDLKALDNKNLNGEAIKQQVEVNTKITLCHQAADYDTAVWASEQSGTQLKSVARYESVITNRLGGEEWDDTRTLNKVEEALISPNKLLQLPERVAVMYRPNHLASTLYTCWVPVDKAAEYPLRPEKPDRQKKPTHKPKKKPKKPEQPQEENIEAMLSDILRTGTTTQKSEKNIDNNADKKEVINKPDLNHLPDIE